MLATLCGLDPSELTNAFHKAENNFWHSTKLNWIVHKYMPRLQRHKIQSLCSPAEFEALKAIIVEMIQEDPRKRPSLSTIALPRPFQGDCCSRPEPPLHQGTANSEPNVSDPEKHGLQARQDLQGPRLSVPNIIVDQDPDPVEEGQHTRTLTPSSQRSESSFLFSQNTTEVSMSSAASILGKEDVWPAAANHELADQPKDQQYEVLAYSSGPWASRTPERGVDPTDLELTSSRRSKSMQERVVGARKTIVIAERAFLGSPLKKEAAFSRQRRESALLSRRSHKHRTIPSRTASPLVSAGTADPARVTKDQVAMALRTFYQDLPAGAAAGDGTFLEGASRRESEVSKRKSIQELVLRFPEAQSDIYDALGSGPIRHPTWPPEQPLRNIPSP